MKHFVSIKTKLAVNTMLIISIIFASVLSVIIFLHIQTANRHMAKSEKNIRDSLIARGNTLIRNNSIAMTGMVADNAFTAIEELVVSTVKEDPDIIYGIFTDASLFPWVRVSPGTPSGQQPLFSPLDDEMAGWFQNRNKKSAYKEYLYHNEKRIEFAAPVFLDRDISGFIRYGFSTQSMHRLLAEAKRENRMNRNHMIIILLALGLLSMLFSFLIVQRLARKITQPLASLVESTRFIAQGNYDIPVRSDCNDEIGLLMEDVDTMRISIRELMAHLKEQERLKNEMELARRIQTVLLPKKPEIQGYEIAASSEPADEVGGDYYDVISLDGHDWIVTGDVSGHGITSGLLMMMVQTAIHTLLLSNPSLSPARLLSSVNRVIFENIRKMDEMKHMTIVVLAAGRKGRFSFAGLHEDILIRRAESGKVEEIETNGFWIGMESDISSMLSTDTLQLAPGDYMVLFTDGVTEARCESGMFGNPRLIEVIENSKGENAFEIHNDIIAALKDCDTPDDVTVLVLKRLI